MATIMNSIITPTIQSDQTRHSLAPPSSSKTDTDTTSTTFITPFRISTSATASVLVGFTEDYDSDCESDISEWGLPNNVDASSSSCSSTKSSSSPMVQSQTSESHLTASRVNDSQITKNKKSVRDPRPRHQKGKESIEELDLRQITRTGSFTSYSLFPLPPTSAGSNSSTFSSSSKTLEIPRTFSPTIDINSITPISAAFSPYRPPKLPLPSLPSTSASGPTLSTTSGCGDNKRQSLRPQPSLSRSTSTSSCDPSIRRPMVGPNSRLYFPPDPSHARSESEDRQHHPVGPIVNTITSSVRLTTTEDDLKTCNDVDHEQELGQSESSISQIGNSLSSKRFSTCSLMCYEQLLSAAVEGARREEEEEEEMKDFKHYDHYATMGTLMNPQHDTEADETLIAEDGHNLSASTNIEEWLSQPEFTPSSPSLHQYPHWHRYASASNTPMRDHKENDGIESGNDDGTLEEEVIALSRPESYTSTSGIHSISSHHSYQSSYRRESSAFESTVSHNTRNDSSSTSSRTSHHGTVPPSLPRVRTLLRQASDSLLNLPTYKYASRHSPTRSSSAFSHTGSSLQYRSSNSSSSSRKYTAQAYVRGKGSLHTGHARRTKESKIVFEEYSSSDEEAFDRSMDIVSSQAPKHPKAQSFLVHKTESNDGEESEEVSLIVAKQQNLLSSPTTEDSASLLSSDIWSRRDSLMTQISEAQSSSSTQITSSHTESSTSYSADKLIPFSDVGQGVLLDDQHDNGSNETETLEEQEAETSGATTVCAEMWLLTQGKNRILQTKGFHKDLPETPRASIAIDSRKSMERAVLVPTNGASMINRQITPSKNSGMTQSQAKSLPRAAKSGPHAKSPTITGTTPAATTTAHRAFSPSKMIPIAPIAFMAKLEQQVAESGSATSHNKRAKNSSSKNTLSVNRSFSKFTKLRGTRSNPVLRNTEVSFSSDSLQPAPAGLQADNDIIMNDVTEGKNVASMPGLDKNDNLKKASQLPILGVRSASSRTKNSSTSQLPTLGTRSTPITTDVSEFGAILSCPTSRATSPASSLGKNINTRKTSRSQIGVSKMSFLPTSMKKR